MLRKIISRAAGSFRRHRSDADIADELNSHLDAHVEDNIRAGMTPYEARRDALLKFGGIAQTVERVRDRRGLPLIDHLRLDIRYALRTMRRDPGFAAGVVLLLAAGIGLNAGIFTVVNSVILRSLPVPEPDRLVVVNERAGRFDTPTSWPDFQDLARSNHVLLSAAAFTQGSDFTFRAGAGARNVKGSYVSRDYFATLGVAPVSGRLFDTAEAESDARVALVREDFWRAETGPGAEGARKTIVVNGVTTDVIGVLPSWFRFPANDTVVWMPLLPRGMQADRGWHAYPMVGRLKAGATLTQAQGDLAAAMQEPARRYPDKNAGRSALVSPLQQWSLAGPVRDRLIAIQVAALVLCLIAFASVSSLFLARYSARRREFSIRAALGASRLRQLSQHVTESLVLTVVGCLLAAGIAWSVVRALVWLYGERLPRVAEIAPDWRLVGAVIAAAVLIAGSLGLITALHQNAKDLDTSLRERSSASAGRRAVLTRQALVVAQIGCAVVLLSITGEVLRGLWSLMRVDIGIERQHLMTMRINLPSANYRQGPVIGDFFDRLVADVRTLPGVSQAAAINMLPVADWGFNGNVNVEGLPSQNRGFFAEYRWVTADYFATVGVPLVRGRLFLPEEIAGIRQAAVINESMARRLWGGKDPLGAHVRFMSPAWITVVGVVRDVRQTGVAVPPSPEIFMPARAYVTGPPAWSLTIRSPLPIESVLPSLRQALARADRDAAIDRVRTMDDVVTDSISNQRIVTALLVSFGVLALALAALAVYSIVAYSVTSRTPELAIRAALGSAPAALVRLVGRQGAALVLLGVIAGLVVTVPASTVVAKYLFGIERISAPVLASVAAALLVAGGLATLIPAARTARIDPLRALRQE
jgi:putative ABC transport system permease protein